MAEPEDKSSFPLRNFTILIAEDEFLIGLDVEAMMRDAGATVLGPFACLITARQAAVHEDFSAAILDFRLGEETTQEVAGILLARAIPFLFYTGQSLPEDVPVVSIIAKPAKRGVLVEAVATLVSKAN